MFGWVDVFSGYGEMIKVPSKALQYCASQGVTVKRIHLDNEAVLH
jgi:hypothetical protein